MCLAVLSTAHPLYPLILLSNRDEYLNRPTERAGWWSTQPQVLSGRDLQHPAQGTWLGITKQGRLAVLTNYRESDASKIYGTRSRGEIAKSYLITPPRSEEPPEEFVRRLVDEDGGLEGVGGFSLMFGQLKQQTMRIGVVSNRTENEKEIIWVTGGENRRSMAQACALSNSHYGDREWPKVVQAEDMLDHIIEDSGKCRDSVEELLDKCFDLLCVDSLPKFTPDRDWQDYLYELKNSIFIPPVGSQDSEAQYATSQQTVLLVDRDGKVIFVERALFNDKMEPLRHEDRERRFEFYIQDWTDD